MNYLGKFPGLLFVLLCAASCYAIRPLPPDQALLRMSPEHGVFVFHSFGFTQSDPNSQNKFEQMMADPEVKTFLAEVNRLVEQLLKKAGEEQTEDERRKMVRGVELARELLPRPMTFYVSKIDLSGDEPDVEAVFVVDAGDQKRAAELVALLQSAAGENQNNSVATKNIAGVDCLEIRSSDDDQVAYVAAVQQMFMATVGKDSFQHLIERGKTPVPAWLPALMERLPVDRPAVLAYADFEEFGKLIARATDPKALIAWKGLGMDHVRYKAVVMGLDEDGILTRGLVSCNQMSGLWKLFDTNGITRETLQAIPQGAQSAACADFDLSEAFDFMLQFVSAVDENAESEINEGLAKASAHLGTDVRRDLLEVLGRNWMIYQGGGYAAMMVPDVIAAVDVTDEARARKLLDKLVEGAKQALARTENSTIVIVPAKFDGTEGYTVRGLPISLSFCVHKDRLVVSLSANGLKQFLGRGPNDASSIVADERVKAMLGRKPDHVAFSYGDVATGLTQSYPSLQMLLNMGAGGLSQQGIDFDPTTLPRPSVLQKYLASHVSSIRHTEDGLEFETREVLPNVSVSSGGVMVALLLPAINAAREAARRNGSINNLRELTLGVLNHESAHGRFPVASKNGLSWRVQILPFLEQQQLYEQFHLDEPWDSAHNKTLIEKMPDVFRSPSSMAAAGKTNYLAIRGADPIIAQREEGLTIRSILDGTSKTVLLVAADDERAVIWTKPDDFDWQAENPAAGLGDLHAGGIFLAAFCDAHTQAIPKTVPKETLKALFTKAGGEAVDPQASLQ